ncbi:MAG TPA: enoyl-CoA hydratase-related protein [Pseudomonadales bacterium]|nr:enoyl-CoA hydratase-related protein [Pseudomonadales bacterium]
MIGTVLYDVQDHVAVITLNRPEKLNALNLAAYAEATAAFAEARADKNVRCIIFTGSGHCFCSGDDVLEIMAQGGGLEQQIQQHNANEPFSSAPPLVNEMLRARSPIINAVNGAAVGMGIELSLLCDIRIASERAKFSEMFVRRGVIGTHVSFNLLPAIVGSAVATEMLLTGCMLSAERALAVGLVSYLTPPEQLMNKAFELAHAIVANPPLAVEKAKLALNLKRDNLPDQIDRSVSESLRQLVASYDHKESVKAFLEKRDPVYRGE